MSSAVRFCARSRASFLRLWPIGVADTRGAACYSRCSVGKGFKGKTCVYCGAANASQTGDHVFAREFFPRDLRANLPKVPACQQCNREKSVLEHYLTTVLPFASQHPEASKLFVGRTPDRLSRNVKLHHALAAGRGRIMLRERGVISPRMTIPFEGEKLAALFRMVLRGLVAHHWDVLIPQDYFVGAGVLAEAGDRLMRELFVKNSNQNVAGKLGGGLILYEGVQAVDNPALTIWRFQMYGGTQFGGDSGVAEVASDIWAMSARTSIPGLFE